MQADGISKAKKQNLINAWFGDCCVAQMWQVVYYNYEGYFILCLLEVYLHGRSEKK
jgi:hypothetical protein